MVTERSSCDPGPGQPFMNVNNAAIAQTVISTTVEYFIAMFRQGRVIVCYCSDVSISLKIFFVELEFKAKFNTSITVYM